MQHKTIVMLMGPPGSGKGTQAKQLSLKLHLPHISTGDLFRENLNSGTALGEKARVFINSGRLVPDELVLDMLFERVSRTDCERGYLLDGFPRTLPQAEAYGRHITSNENVKVLNLEVPVGHLLKRLTGRLTCKACGHIHNIYFTPPKISGTCDVCGGELVQRADDSEAVVVERLEVYDRQTKPLIAHYQEAGCLKSIDGTRHPEVVLKNLLAALE